MQDYHGLGVGMQASSLNVKQPTLTDMVADAKAVRDRVNELVVRAHGAADRLRSIVPMTSEGNKLAEPIEPSGLVDQLAHVNTQTQRSLDSLNRALDRIVEAHG